MARSGTPTKPRTAKAKAVKPIRALKKTKSHRARNLICGFLAGILSIAALLGTVSHILPAEIQAWPYVPIIVSCSANTSTRSLRTTSTISCASARPLNTLHVIKRA